MLAKFVGARASWPNLSAVPSGAQLRASTARKEAVANSSMRCVTHTRRLQSDCVTCRGTWHEGNCLKGCSSWLVKSSGVRDLWPEDRGAAATASCGRQERRERRK